MPGPISAAPVVLAHSCAERGETVRWMARVAHLPGTSNPADCTRTTETERPQAINTVPRHPDNSRECKGRLIRLIALITTIRQPRYLLSIMN